MTIQKLQESGRFPHAVLILGGDERAVEQVVTLHKSDPSDTVYVKESMPPSDTEKKSKTATPPYSYKIDALREVVALGNLRPQFGDTRVFVFNDFESMSENCQNALLKFVEEPPEYNRFVITAQSKSKILTTILSRVVVVQSGEVQEAEVGEIDEIAGAIMSAIKGRNKSVAEYDTAAAFSRIKDRTVLTCVLERLLCEFASLMAVSKKPEKLIAACDVLQKYIKRTAVNPNVPMTTAACAAELHTVIHVR
ncbi:MAG: hypothetical protein FWG45_07480 [Oscillospiraceae bacterium]|nr:hypothetical protein [Oscillospiraceae bacterium]